MLTIFPKKSNTLAVLSGLVHQLKVKVSPLTLSNTLLEHPNYPSLLSLSDSLTEWNIPHDVYQVKTDDKDLSDLPFPFIAHLRDSENDSSRFILVSKVTLESVEFGDEVNTKNFISIEDFLGSWNGVLLSARKQEKSGEENFGASVIKGWINKYSLLFFVILAICASLFIVHENSVGIWGYAILFTKMSGLAVTSLLLTHLIDANSSLVQSFCSSGEQSSCNSILNSPSAKVTSWLSWSEVGFCYFCSTFISFLIKPELAQLIGFLAVLTVPYTFYSLGYQLTTRKWCVLCCSVLVILWLEVLTFFLRFESFDSILLLTNVQNLTILFFSIAFPISVWALIKVPLLNATKLSSISKQLNDFKYNSDLFEKIITSQPQISIPDHLKSIELGNLDAANTITILSNPFCSPCAKAHLEIDKLLHQRDDVKVKVIFAARGTTNDDKLLVSRHLTAIGNQKGHIIASQALSEWYSSKSKSYQKLASDFPVTVDADIEALVDEQIEWCKNSGFTATPTILLNGYELVRPYKVADVKYFLN